MISLAPPPPAPPPPGPPPAVPRPRWEVENSILLRILVQTLVVIGIGATAVAAVDVAEPLTSIYGAIPLSIAGSVWSYRQRRKRNIGMKFLIALGMLVALANFFVALVEQANDTRLVLADLLIQIQALHCFDLPRRKDLGYSMVIGLILMGVAANLSQTLRFAPFILLFLAVAFPVLVLDYRSRLGLPPVDRSQPRDRNPKTSPPPWPPELAPRRLGVLLAVALGLGLVIFAALPRLPGYQLRNYPVSTPLTDLPTFSNNQLVRNPAYRNRQSGDQGQQNQEEGDATSVQGSGGSPTRGPGSLDPEYYYGFNTTINQNLRSSPDQEAIPPKLLMRVRSQAEGFWRVMSFDRYTGQGWEVSRNTQTQTLKRPVFSYRFLLPLLHPVGRSREVVQTYTIVGDLPNLIPALHQARELYFPTTEIALDPEGGMRAPMELTDGTTYTVISDVPYRDRTALGQAGTNYPPTILRHYLQLPSDPQLQLRIRAETEALLATSPKPLTSVYEQALYLGQQLKQRYSLQPDLPFWGEGQDMVESFLFQSQGGYPDHFSTVMTIMLRSLGIPARLVAGFGSGEFNPFTGLYLVRNTDAYAMTEVYFPGWGWFAFDPIPGHPLVPPSLEESYAFSTIKKLWLWVAGWLPSPVRGIFSTVFLWLSTGLSRLITGLFALFSQGISGFLLGTIILVGLAWGVWVLGSWALAWGDRRRLARLSVPQRVYTQLLRHLAQRDYPKHPTETPLEYGQRLQVQLQRRYPPEVLAAIATIIEGYSQWCYGGIAGDGATLEGCWAQVQGTPPIVGSSPIPSPREPATNLQK